MIDGKFAFLIIIPMMTMVMIPNICSADDLPMPSGINYCGVGYNIIEGNPEGGDLSTGGVDPGLLLTRRIFKLSFDQGKVSADRKYQIPDEVSFKFRNSAYTTSSLSTFYGTESYASKLSAQVEVEGGYEGVMAEVKFAASLRYQRVSQKTSSEGSVFLSNETIQNHGHARYQTELALTGKYSLTDGFVAEVCRLPVTYTQQDYMDFIDAWGTHVVTEVALGIREGENLEEKRSSFVNFASTNVEGSVSASGAYGGFSASVSVNMESFTSAMDSGTSFGRSYSKYIVGSKALNEPISLKLIAMPDVFEPDFWSGLNDYIDEGHCTASFEMDKVQANMANALQGYAEWKEIKQSTNPDIRIPITWPDGVYGLPKPLNGCPNSDQDFTWNEGHRIHVSQSGGSSERSNPVYTAGWWQTLISREDFCMKTVSTVNTRSRWEWQPGSYCIFQYGPKCPDGFTSGNIHWDDGSKWASTLNSHYGILPEGEYGDDTDINFCCRNDGVPTHAIYLPIDDKFLLLARFDQCQLVDGMSVKKMWLFWDTEGNSLQSGDHPFNGLNNGGVRLMYCYYHVGDIEFTEKEKQAYILTFAIDTTHIARLFGQTGKR